MCLRHSSDFRLAATHPERGLFNMRYLRYRVDIKAGQCKPHGRLRMARTRMVNRWRRNMDVSDDAEYVDMLTTLSEGSVRRNFNPYTDIDWDSPEFAVVDNDERWILPAPIRSAATPGTRRNRSSGRSRSACGDRPTSPRSACTSSRS